MTRTGFVHGFVVFGVSSDATPEIRQRHVIPERAFSAKGPLHGRSRIRGRIPPGCVNELEVTQSDQTIYALFDHFRDLDGLAQSKEPNEA